MSKLYCARLHENFCFLLILCGRAGTDRSLNRLSTDKSRQTFRLGLNLFWQVKAHTGKLFWLFLYLLPRSPNRKQTLSPFHSLRRAWFSCLQFLRFPFLGNFESLGKYNVLGLAKNFQAAKKNGLVNSFQLSYKIILTSSEIIFTSLLIIFISLLIIAGTKKAGSAPRRALPACKANLAIYSRCAKSEKVLRRVLFFETSKFHRHQKKFPLFI